VGCWVPDYGEEVTPDAAAGGFHQPKGGVGGNRGVYRGATPPHSVEGDLRGERLAGGSHGTRRVDLWAGGKWYEGVGGLFGSTDGGAARGAHEEDQGGCDDDECAHEVGHVYGTRSVRGHVF